MGFIDSLKSPLRVRFVKDRDGDDESKTAFLQETAQSAKHGTIIVARRSLYFILYAFMLSTLLLLSIIALQNRNTATDNWSEDVLGRGPPKPHMFSHSYNYSAPDSPMIRALYKQYFREDDMGIPVQNPAKYGLPPGYPSKKDKSVEVYHLSYNHQFHCLILFREAWWDLRTKYENKTYPTEEAQNPSHIHNTFDEPETQKEHWDHVEHCIDYLRQVIKCNADTTLSSTRTASGATRTA
ncbi:hypothetical protein GE09DRAFT_676430 [Coniochaeta sp. 2T2.1]|nr:hypothetical protein GE09DRAFT_676430 [Coniochaeta sp. 2T2.1]